MAEFSAVDPGTIALIQQTKDGRIQQIGLTVAQSNMLQFFLSKLSESSPLIAMGEDYDLVLKSQIKRSRPNCGACGKKHCWCDVQ